MVCDVESKIDDTVLFSKVKYNKEIRKIKLNEIEVQLKKYKKLNPGFFKRLWTELYFTIWLYWF